MNFIIKHKYTLTLSIILIVSAVLRFYGFATRSMSNDELSALSRLQYQDIFDVIKNGVMINDTHPSGVQIFLYYWTMIFGFSPAAVRFPFVILGIISVYLVYRISEIWHNKNVGLVTASIFSVLGYTILYSYIARPYSVGLFFSLLFVLNWSYLIFKKEKSLKVVLGFIIGGAGAAYSHYFSLMFVFIVGISGFVFLKKEIIKSYILSSLAVFVLFIPHIPIFYYQYTNGLDNVSWIPVPKEDWIWKYLKYAINNSGIFKVTLLIIFHLGMIYGIKHIKTLYKKIILAFLWFILPFGIGYLYSIYKAPMLQYSVLLFSFPYLILFFAGYMPFMKKKFVFPSVLIILIIGTYTLITDFKFYTKPHFGEFKALSEKIAEWDKKHPSNTAAIFSVHNPYYAHYYTDKLIDDYKFEKYLFKEKDDFRDLYKIVNNTNKDYFIYAYSTTYNSPEIIAIIKEKFPIIEEKDILFNSGAILFKKANDKFFIHKEFYSFDTVMNNNIDTGIFYSPNRSIVFNTEYSPFKYEKPISSFGVKDSFVLSLQAQVKCDSLTKGNMVMEIRRQDSIIFWGATSFEDYKNDNTFNPVFVSNIFNACPKYSTTVEPTDKLKIYFWNRSKNTIHIDDVLIKIREKDY